MANTGNTQQQINYGAAANDGQGDPLRTAFIKTDDNFDAIWNAGPVGSNITILNNTVQSNNTNGNIVLRPNGVGVIQANASVVPNATNLRDLGTADLRFRAAYVGTGGLSVDGNVTVTGNLTAGNISYTGNVFVGDLQGSVYADDSTIMVDAVDNEMFASAATFGRANVTGNVAANFFIGNGSLLTGVAASYGNANVATFLASGFGNVGSNTVVANGNIVASAVSTSFIVNQFPLNIQTSGGGVWEFAGNILRGPQGGSWSSDTDTSYFNSPANGFLNLSSLQNGNVVSELFMEHSFIRFFIDNGIDATWEMKADGRTEFPSYTFPYADGNAGEVLKTDGSGNLAWTTDSSDYGNANVATLLAAFGSNSISTTGNVTANNINAGNVFIARDTFAKTGSFSGDSRGENAIYAGVPLFTVLGSDVVAQFSANVDNYTQFNFQNGNSGSLASGDYVITADNGNDSTYFVNLGLGSSNHDDPDFFGDTSSPNDAYLYVVGADATGPGDTGPGNLIIGSTNGVIKFFVGNTAQANVVQTITTAGVTMTGNIIPSANAVYSLGNATNYWSNLWVASNTIYIGGVALGVTGNTLTVAGEPVLSNDSESNIATTGTITAGNIITNGISSDDSTFVTVQDGLSVAGDIESSGNITVDYFFGNGSLLTGVASTGNITFSDTTVSPPDGVDITISAANSEVIIEALDIRLDSTDDLRLTGSDLVSLRNRSTTDPVTIITDYDDTETTWTFAVDGSLTTPGDIVVAGDVTGTASANTLVLKAQPASNTSIQLNSIVDSVISTVADLEIRTDVSNTAKTFDFGADGRLILPESSEANVAKLTSPPNDANVSLQLYSGNAVRIVSNTVGEPFVWTFGTTGTFTAAGNISAGNITTTGRVSASGNILGLNFATEGSVQASSVEATGNITGANLSVTGNITGNVSGFAIGYRDIPQVSFTGNATTAAADAGKHFYSTESTDYILTIADNSAVSWPVGTAITVVNRGTGNITVAQAAGVSLYLAGNSSAGNRTVTTYGMVTLLNVAANVWMINGTGVA